MKKVFATPVLAAGLVGCMISPPVSELEPVLEVQTLRYVAGWAATNPTGFASSYQRRYIAAFEAREDTCPAVEDVWEVNRYKLSHDAAVHLLYVAPTEALTSPRPAPVVDFIQFAVGHMCGDEHTVN